MHGFSHPFFGFEYVVKSQAGLGIDLTIVWTTCMDQKTSEKIPVFGPDTVLLHASSSLSPSIDYISIYNFKGPL